MSNAKSKTQNVHWSKGRQCWVARVRIGGKVHHLGRYRTIDEAEAVVTYFRACGVRPPRKKRKRDRLCYTCREHPRTVRRDGSFGPYCQKCRDRINADRNRKYRTGITPKAYALMLESHGGRCAICRRLPRTKMRKIYQLHVDHCHSNGQVRGLLCRSCNMMLGLVAEDPKVLYRAIKYLRGDLMVDSDTPGE